MYKFCTYYVTPQNQLDKSKKEITGNGKEI